MSYFARLLSPLILLLTLLFYTQGAVALEVPPLKSRVNDYGNILASATETQLEHALKSFESDQSTQLVVLTIPSLEGESLEEFSIKVAEAWKIGQKDLDNGAILLIAKDDRKLRIEVGYGLEGRLTDLVSGQIIRNVIVPRFKEGNFNQGVIDGISAMMAAVQGEFSAADVAKKTKGRSFLSSGFFLYFFIILFFILSKFFGRSTRGLRGSRRRSSYYIGGGGFGGGFGGGGFSGGGGGFGGGGASGGW